MPQDLTLYEQPITTLGELANRAAVGSVFIDYRVRRAANTLRRQDADLALFAEYLHLIGLPVEALKLATHGESWQGITFGLVEGFQRWQLQQGYAIGSVNVRLSTIKVYAALAFKAGVVSAAEHALIRMVKNYTHKEGKRVDEKRAEAEVSTRHGAKKAIAVSLTRAQAQRLKEQPDTPQGRRDALLMCLLLDHGLRCGEVAVLKIGNVNLKTGELAFYRPKVDKQQTHRLTADTLKAARAYFKAGDASMLADVPLLRASRKGGQLTTDGMSERAITKRVYELGKAQGIEGLSAHDCRHFWATAAARAGTPIDRLQDAGGWNSPAMPLRYIEAAKIANEGVKLE
jgi:integrase